MECSTKVKIVRPTDLKSYKLLKEAEQILLSDESQILSEDLQNSLSCLTLNNLGCFYKKLDFNKVALEYFLQVLSLEKILDAEKVSMASTMLNICANLSK